MWNKGEIDRKEMELMSRTSKVSCQPKGAIDSFAKAVI